MKQIKVLCMMAMALWASALSAQSHWQCDIAAYQNSMAVYFQLADGENIINDVSPYEVAAFVNDDCRGVATFEQVVSGGNTYKYGYLRIRSNSDSGETVHLKVFNKLTQEEKRIAGAKFNFEQDLRMGYPSQPVTYDITASVPKYQVTATAANAVMGTVEGSGLYEEDELAHLTATPNSGYHFVKWSDDNTEATRSIVVTVAIQIQAIFAPNQHRLTFISEGDTVMTVMQDYASTIVPPANPEKEGYSFTKWIPALATTMPDYPLTYTAEFKINEYTMTFVVDGKTIREAVLEYGKNIPVPNTPTKEGFTFDGWDPSVPATVPGHNMTFTAKWKRNKYLVTFMSEGEVVKSDSVEYEAAITLPDNPTKKGYSFTAWSPEVPEKMPATDVTYTAQFAINQYTIQFVADEEILLTRTLDYGAAIIVPRAPDKEGYTFAGWNPEVPEVVPDSNVVFTAQYTPNKYLATFISEGVVVKSDSVTYLTTIVKPTNPEKEGYSFTGWDPEIPETMPAHDVTYTAQFSINQYKMTFVFDNGAEDVVKTQDYGTDLTAPADLEKVGFTFKGWDPAVPATVPASDMTFTAQWDRNKYKVTWIVDGNTYDQQEVLYEAEILIPDSPMKEGYTFTGWTPEIPDSMPANDLTFTAQFSINQYKMTFVFDNGAEDVVKTQDYGTDLTAPADPEKVGFTFKGWNPAVPATVPASDMTFTAQWDRNKYKVTWIVDGNTYDQQEVLYEAEILIPDSPTKEGYTFTGWTPEIPDSMPANDMTFTAQFSINQYKMTFVFDNGEENIVKTQDYGTDLTAPADPTKTGFTFKGWDPAVPATVPASDMTFTAQWERNIYKVTWIVEGQSTVKDVAYGAPIEKPTDPTKEGYTFTGWTPEVPATMPANDLTFTAQFSINQYKMTFVLGNGQENVVKTLDYGTALTAPANPTRTGFTFKGWDPAVPATVPASDMTFTAQWDRNVYAVIYMVHGKEWQRDSLAYEAPIQLRTYSEDGWTFNGWVSDATYVTMPAHDVVYTADITSGIATILAGKSEVDVYTLQGRLVARRMPVAQIRKTLPHGVYIIEGTKVVIR